MSATFIKNLKAELRRPIGSLLALAPQHDPFYADREGRRLAAEWFAEHWHRHGFGGGTHLRRIHYRLISQAVPVSHENGEPYENTDRSWERLLVAARDARYLKLVPLEDFADHRNDDAIEHAMIRQSGAVLRLEEPRLFLPQPFPERLSGQLPSAPDFIFDAATVDQRYLVELWAEKTTLNDVLLGLARTYGLNVITASGEISLTRCHELVQRALRIQRPVRILYVSDFDPGGMSMPVACARKIEFLIDDLDLDIEVLPIALTHEQCVQYRLPRTPIKATERRAAAFEQRFGEGATEVDALEALHPGALREILEREIARYFDFDLDDRVRQTADDFQAELDAAREEILGRHRAERAAILREYRRLVDRLNPELEAIADRYRKPYQKIAEGFRRYQEKIVEELGAEAPDVDSIDWPEPRGGDEHEDPLFDSTRDYVEQIDRYKTHQGKAGSIPANGMDDES